MPCKSAFSLPCTHATGSLIFPFSIRDHSLFMEGEEEGGWQDSSWITNKTFDPLALNWKKADDPSLFNMKKYICLCITWWPPLGDSWIDHAPPPPSLASPLPSINNEWFLTSLLFSSLSSRSNYSFYILWSLSIFFPFSFPSSLPSPFYCSPSFLFCIHTLFLNPLLSFLGCHSSVKKKDSQSKAQQTFLL